VPLDDSDRGPSMWKRLLLGAALVIFASASATAIGALHDVDKVVERATNPATSGDHFAAGGPDEPGSGALADGAFLETPPENRTVHSLEHGRINIQYSPDLPEEDQLALKGLFDSQPEGILLFPNADMPYDVAATAWTQLVGCDGFEGGATLDVLRAFRDQFLGRGPEPVAYDPDQLG